MKKRLEVVSAETPHVQRAVDVAKSAGFSVTVGADGYRLAAGPFESADELLAHLVRGGFRFGEPCSAESPCVYCSKFDAVAGDEQYGEVQASAAAASKPSLEVVR